MAIALDSTAHPSNGGNLTNFNDGGGSPFTTVATPSFSTGAGPILFVFMAVIDSGINNQGPGTVANTSGLVWTRRVTQFDGSSQFGAALWTAFSSTGSLTSQTVTLTTGSNTAAQTVYVALQVYNGVGSTEAASFGNTAGVNDSAGVSATVNLTLTPAASNSWLVGLFSQLNDATALTADSNTSAFDNTHAGAFGGYFALGRYKVSGTVALTTASSAVTFGSSTSDLFRANVAIEVKVAASGGNTWTGTQSETATPSDTYATAQGMLATQAESTTASDTYSTAQAMLATQAESATATDAMVPGVAMGLTQAESTAASAAFALGLAIGAAQAESTASDVLFACSLAMGASQSEGTSPVVIFDDGTTPARHSTSPFWPWWYRLQPKNRRRIV